MVSFEEIFVDVTKEGKKIPTKNYLSEGSFPIIDQGRNLIAGYSNDAEGLYVNVPAIVFGDHTRVFKYVDKPFFWAQTAQRLYPAIMKKLTSNIGIML